MKQIVNKALMFDFYGPLLTAKQAKIWDFYYQQDYTLAEIAEEEGITRQAVHDLLRRTERILEGYELKLKLISRFLKEKEKLAEIELLLQGLKREDYINEAAWKRHLDIAAAIKEIISADMEDVK